ncbi:hypothetical protein RclHR1_15400008 [Rhizophagus clarus]|uniref:Uncharacterized protein n=1 Tax=Rhizophagus clarus TaxID=94130 RepID=A0A2Z6QGT3_9GLOM|nr:hypothetical protein RclHR1_15400008 [Rhizophagus clarus]
MNFDGIKVVKKHVFTMNECDFNEINKYKRGQLEFESKEDWMKKINLFVDVSGINITNFARLGLLVEGLQDKSFNKEIMSAINIWKLVKSNDTFENIGIGSSNVNIGFKFNNSKRNSKFYNFNHIGSLGRKHPDNENFDEKV